MLSRSRRANRTKRRCAGDTPPPGLSIPWWRSRPGGPIPHRRGRRHGRCARRRRATYASTVGFGDNQVGTQYKDGLLQEALSPTRSSSRSAIVCSPSTASSWRRCRSPTGITWLSTSTDKLLVLDVDLSRDTTAVYTVGSDLRQPVDQGRHRRAGGRGRGRPTAGTRGYHRPTDAPGTPSRPTARSVQGVLAEILRRRTTPAPLVGSRRSSRPTARPCTRRSTARTRSSPSTPPPAPSSRPGTSATPRVTWLSSAASCT